MKKEILNSTFSASELSRVEFDIGESMAEGMEKVIDEIGEENFIKGKVRINIEWLSEDDCDCIGFQHSLDCPHHVMSY